MDKYYLSYNSHPIILNPEKMYRIIATHVSDEGLSNPTHHHLVVQCDYYNLWWSPEAKAEAE